MGRYHILKEYANGVMDEKGRFYPYKGGSLASSVSGKQGIRFYLKSVQLALNNTGIHAATTLTNLTMTVKGVSATVAILTTPITTADVPIFGGVSAHIGILGDINTGFGISNTGDLDYVIAIYAEIDELEGEYDG